MAETRQGFLVVLLLETAIPQIIMCQSVHIGIAVAGVVEIGAVVGGSFRILLLPVTRLSPPEIRLAADFRAVCTRLNGTGEESGGFVRLGIGKSLCAQLKQHVLLCFQYLVAGAVDLFNRCKSRLIVFGGHIHFRQIIVHLVGVFRTGEVVEEALKDADRLTEAGEVGFMYQQGVVIESRLADLLVKRSSGGSLESHAGVVLLF
ncbi:hypothetical protein Barb7_02655 [Bacteroidales bacterium Barb7]|nr:hypothetical protein Barb7_02655 [Bacteroidales bacterium Barb7]